MRDYLFALIFYSLAVRLVILTPQVPDENMRSIGAVVATFGFMLGTYLMVHPTSKATIEKKEPADISNQTEKV